MSERLVVGQKAPADPIGGLMRMARAVFLAGGILPVVLVIAIVGFGAAEPRFLTYDNMFNVTRAASYLVVVSIGQMLTLLVRGVDMSIGSTEALVSVCVALCMATVLGSFPDSPGLAITLGIAAGLAVGVAVGTVNGIGIAVFNVNPFIMTVGMLSILSGVALTVSGGMPMYGMPEEFSRIFAYAAPFGIPAPVLFAAGLYALMVYVLNWTPFGRRIYALGGNGVAARLAGISTRLHTVLTYAMCSTIVAFGGVLLTARVGTGEATLGATHVLESITAVVIAGVSFFGGIGRVGSVVLGAFFVTLVTNGMNLLRVPSYQQLIVLGVLLILAVVVDQLRMRMLQQQRPE
ncbi:ABC transporter permease [Reyranella sp.]|uniref:ABC transporter permease n=1 Tax=Reyranella sp. TaxID=1929291 RepID=UPI003BA88ECD